MMRSDDRIHLRPARAEEQLLIWRMVITAGLNPINLRWKNFSMLEGPQGSLIGCGQIKPHKDGSRELASIYVIEEQRGQGFGGAIIRGLLDREAQPIWLTCRRELTGFYERFGFEEINDPGSMPPYFSRVKRLVGLFTKVSGENPLAVMCRHEA